MNEIVSVSTQAPYAAYQHAVIMIPIGLLIARFMLVGLKETHCRQTGQEA